MLSGGSCPVRPTQKWETAGEAFIIYKALMSNFAIAGLSITMTSRDIAELVESRHADVCRTIDRLMESTAISRYAPMAYTHPQNGQQYSEYHIGQRDSYVVVAQLSPQFTGRLVDRWQELESSAKTPSLPDFTNPAEAARAWADEIEAKQALQIELAAAAPAIEFKQKYVDSTGSKGFREVCKLLGAKEPAFREFLAERKIMYRLHGSLAPYAEHLDAGRFEVKTGTSDVTGHAFNTARFTPKGITWVAGEWAKFNLVLK